MVKKLSFHFFCSILHFPFFLKKLFFCKKKGLFVWYTVDKETLSCGPLLVTGPNVVWQQVTVLVIAIVFVTTTLASDCLLCQILPCPRCVWKIHEGGWHNSAGSFSDGQIIWVARLSSNSKKRENLLFNKQQKIVFIETRLWDKRCLLSWQKRRNNIERGRVTMRCG